MSVAAPTTVPRPSVRPDSPSGERLWGLMAEFETPHVSRGSDFGTKDVGEAEFNRLFRGCLALSCRLP